MEYQLIRSSSLDIMQEKVNQSLSCGWELYCHTFLENNYYHQAMIRKSK